MAGFQGSAQLPGRCQIALLGSSGRCVVTQLPLLYDVLNSRELVIRGHLCPVRGDLFFWSRKSRPIGLSLADISGPSLRNLLVNDRLINSVRINTYLSPVFRCYLKFLCQFTSQVVGGAKWSKYSREPRGS